MSEREFPAEISAEKRPLHSRRPFTPLEALMQAAPGIEPDESQLELLALRDVLEDAIEKLTPRERWVFNAHVVERQGVRRIAKDLGLAKSTVHLIVQQAKKKLAAELINNEVIRDRLDLA